MKSEPKLTNKQMDEIDNKATDWERAILIPDNFKKAGDIKFEIDNKAIDWGRKEIITYKVYIKHDKHKNCNLDVLLEDLENIISGLSKIVAAIKDTGYNVKYYVNEEENICTYTFVMERMI